MTIIMIIQGKQAVAALFRFFRLTFDTASPAMQSAIMEWDFNFGSGYITHDMTDDDSPPPKHATSRDFIDNGTGPAWHAFDGSLATAIQGSDVINDNGWWMKIDFGVGNEGALSAYKLTSPASGFQQRMPINWTVDGSNNDSDWTPLDVQTIISWTFDETKEFFV